MTQVMVIGESLVDILCSPGQPDTPVPGGSAANSAVALARLGHHVELVTDIGTDQHGRLLLDHLAESGVSLAEGSVREGRSSSALARLDQAGVASYTFDMSWAPPAVRVDPAVQVVHVSSVAAVQPWATGSVLPTLRLAREVGAVVTFDPNIRPALVSDPLDVWRAVEQAVCCCDLVKLSDEDAEWLAGVAGLDVDVMVDQWSRNDRLVVMTRGASSTVAMMAGESVVVQVPPAQVVDTVGAGDSFIAGVIDEFLALMPHDDGGPLWRGRPVARLLGRGAQIAAVTVSRAGANPPWRQEVGGRVLPASPHPPRGD